MWMSWNRLVKRSRRLAVPVLIVALLCAVSHLQVLPTMKIRQVSYEFIPTAAIDTSSTAVGIADSDLYFMSAAEVATTLDVMQAMGVNQVRIFVPWAAVEAKQDVYDWSKVDMVVNAAADRGMAVLAAVTSTPKWAGGTTFAPNTAPWSTAAYAQFMGDLATRYGAANNGGEAKVSAYEIWNEPNGFAGWSPAPSPKAYTALLKAAYTAIKAADPTSTVVGGVLGAGISFGGLTINPVSFLKQMYAAGAEGYFDALSFHPYQNKTKFSAGYNANYPLQQLQAMRDLMNLNGDSNKLIWNTEYGLPTTKVSESTQAAFVQDLLNTWSGLTGVGPMFFYTTRDREANSKDSEDNFGLFHYNWTPKLVVKVIEDWIAAHPGAVLPTDPTTPTDPTDPTGPTTPTNPSDPLAAFVTQVVNALNDWLKSLAAAMNPAKAAAVTTQTVTPLSASARLAPVVQESAVAGASAATTASDPVTATVASGAADTVTAKGEDGKPAEPAAEATEAASSAPAATEAAPVSESAPVTEAAPTQASAPVESKTTESDAATVAKDDDAAGSATDTVTATKKADDSSSPAAAPKPRKPWKKSGPVTKPTDKPGSLRDHKRKTATADASDTKASESSKDASEG